MTQKGYELLIEAMRGVVSERPNVKLVLVGDGPLRDTLANQAEMLGLENHILFVGQRSDVENILSISDLFVSSSLWEGLPTVIIESMAACVPVVATDVSGTRELIQDGVTGYLVRPGDSDALCRKITDVMDRFQDTRSVVQCARADVERRFTVDNAADCYINLYRGLTR